MPESCKGSYFLKLSPGDRTHVSPVPLLTGTQSVPMSANNLFLTCCEQEDGDLTVGDFILGFMPSPAGSFSFSPKFGFDFISLSEIGLKLFYGVSLVVST